MKKQLLSEFQSKEIAYNHIVYNTVPYTIDFHCHDVFEIIYLKNGDLTYNIEGKQYHINKNHLIITRPFMTHSINVNSEIYERYDFLFESSIIKSSFIRKLPNEMNVIDLNNYPEIAKIFNKTDRYFDYFNDDELKRVLAITIEEIFYNIIIVSEKFSKGSINGNYSTNPTIASAVEFINKNLTEPFTIEDICKELFISKSYLHRLFLQHIKTTPQKYIASKRLLLAQKELRDLAKPTEVYTHCGFSDYSSFYRAYKKHFGYPPSEELNQKIVRTIEF